MFAFTKQFRSQTNIDLLYQEYIDDDNIWKDSYYLHTYNDEFYGLQKCLTLNVPIEKLTKPNHAQVSKHPIQLKQ